MNSEFFGYPSPSDRILLPSRFIRGTQPIFAIDFRTMRPRPVYGNRLPGLAIIDGGGVQHDTADIGLTVPGALFVPWTQAVAQPTAWFAHLPAGDFVAVLQMSAAGGGNHCGLWLTNQLTQGGGEDTNCVFIDKNSGGQRLAGVGSGTNTWNQSVQWSFRWHQAHNWIRMMRIGATYYASFCHDGVSWLEDRTFTAAAATPLYAGFGTGELGGSNLHSIAVYSFRIWQGSFPASPPPPLVRTTSIRAMP